MKEMIQTLGRTKKMNWCHSIIEVACMQRITKKIYHLDSALTILMVWYLFCWPQRILSLTRKLLNNHLHTRSHTTLMVHTAQRFERCRRQYSPYFITMVQYPCLLSCTIILWLQRTTKNEFLECE